MADLTIAELAAQLPDGDSVKAWWEAAAALPGDADTAEFFLKTLNAAYKAANVKNQSLAAGSRIDSYPAPTNSAVTIDPNSGIQSFVTTYSVRGRVPVPLDNAIATAV